MGTGIIAGALVYAIRAEGDQVVAVSSASPDRAGAFAEDHGIPRSYGAHHALLEDPEVEVVYVATTSDRHHLDVLACIEAGVPVLAEKPFALDHARGAAAVDAARAAGVFVMEAMWMRFSPGFLDVERRVAAGEIGPVRLVNADFGFAAEPDHSRRWFARDLGGGALLDVGIYPLTLACSLLGPPIDVQAVGELAATGVDAQVAIAMRHATGVSSCLGSFVADSGVEATIAGPAGSLRMQGPFHNTARVSRRSGQTVVEDVEVVGHEQAYRHEVREVQRCLDAGEHESPRMPLAFTLQLASVMDEVRRQVGVVYDDPVA